MLDELASGVPMFGAPDIERTFGVRHAMMAVGLFFVPGAIALVLDPVVFLLADRWPRRWFIRGGLAVMALSAFVAALAPNLATVSLAVAAWYVADSAVTALTEATLVDRDPDHRARTMTRWSLLGQIGDFITPVMFAGLAGLGLGWRTGFAIVGAIMALWWLGLTVRDLPEPPPPPPATGDDGGTGDGASESLLDSLRAALRDRVLLGWLFGVVLCDLLDEILVVFASLHVRVDLGASATWQSITIGSFVVGGAIGLVILERLLSRWSEQKLLIASGLICAVTYAVWLAAPTVWLSALLMLLVGASAVPLYPLASARAYARRPGKSGSVLAASQLFSPFALAVPWLLGLVADRAGVVVALALLIAQPLGLVALAVVSRDRRAR